jgi:hypothetical protein
VKAKFKIRIAATEMRFMRQMAKYTQMDYKINKDLSILDKILNFESNWIQHATRQFPKLLRNKP